MTEFDRSHGSPYDRGDMDYYYGRPPIPHYRRTSAVGSERVTELTELEKREYFAGYRDAEENGDRKE